MTRRLEQLGRMGIPLFFGVFFTLFSWLVAVPKAQAMTVSVTASAPKVGFNNPSGVLFSIQAIGASRCTLIERKNNGADWIETSRAPWPSVNMTAGPTTSRYVASDPAVYSHSKTLTCTDAAGVEQSSSATVEVVAEVVSLSLQAAANSEGKELIAGGAGSLVITARGATHCSVSGYGSAWFALNAQGVGSVYITPTVDTTYSVICFVSSPYGRVSEPKTRLVTVAPSDQYSGPLPHVNFMANEMAAALPFTRPIPILTVDPGATVDLSWQASAHASKCTALNGNGIPYGGQNSAAVTSMGWGNGTVLPTSGSKNVTVPTTPGFYTLGINCSGGTFEVSSKFSPKAIDIAVLDPNPTMPATCKNPDNSCADRTCEGNVCQNSCGVPIAGKVNCVPVPDISSPGTGGPAPTSLITSFTTNLATLATPGDITLTWRTSNATSCTASGDWDGNITPLSGSRTVTVNGTTAFHLECRSASSTDQKSVYVTVGSGCTPNVACAIDTCNTQTCPDGCGGYIAGTKDCGPIPGCIDDNSCATNKCKDETCTNNCNKTIPGIKDCIAGGASTCQGTCRQSCLSNEEKAQVGLCATSAQTCCTTKATPPSGSSTTYASFAISNPLSFNTVDDVFTSLLSFFQAAIVLFSLIFILIGAFFYITSAGDDSRMETGKKAILASLIGLALGIAAPAFLKEIASILGWGNPTLPQGVGTSLSLLEIAENVLSFLLTIIGILAIIMLVVGGTFYLTAAGNEDQIDKGKKIITYSLIGILIALGSLVLVRQVAEWFG